MTIEPVTFGMPMDVYLADPCPEPSLSSGSARTILERSPARAWAERLGDVEEEVDQSRFDIGTACHTLVLRTGAAFQVIDAPDYRTKAAKEARDEARAAGLTPLLADQFALVEAMHDALRAHLEEHECRNVFAPGAGKAEASIFWKDGGAWKRARPDWIEYEGEEPRAVYHYKTVSESAAPHHLSRLAANRGWDFTAAHYAEGCRAVFGRDIPQRFVVQEKDPPHEMVIFELDPAAMETAAMRLERATYLWARCVANNHWPGYPRNLLEIGTPEYHQSRMIEMKDAENAYRQEHGRDILDRATRWQGGRL